LNVAYFHSSCPEGQNHSPHWSRDVVKIAVIGARPGVQTQGLFALFGASGGSIGRAKTNQLVLDDPDRTVSRVHAQVVSRGEQFVLVDQGSNPLLHNGKAVGAGNEVRLNDGDKLQIGGFELVVNMQSVPVAASPSALIPDDMTMLASSHKQAAAPVANPSDDDPFADLLAGLTDSAPTVATSNPIPNAAVKPSVSERADPFADPLGTFSASSTPAGVDPFDDLLNFGSTKSVVTGSSSVSQLSAGDMLASLSPAKTSSIDELFGLDGSGLNDDPLGASPVAQPVMQPNTAHSADPLVALQSAHLPSNSAHSDHVSALQQAYAAPKVVQTAEPSSFSAPLVKPAPVFPSASAPATNPLLQPSISVAAAVRSSGDVSEQELLAAFLRGAKMSNNMPTQLTPELMEKLGSLLHTATHGTLQLLMSRQELKQGFRSDVTMIMSEANNPLKFSPTAEIALAHLLGPRTKGFMDAEQAMAGAYADLRAHQFGVMVGMKAALAHVLLQFAPDKLEGKLAEKSKLDAIFTSGRKAKLWELFCQLYSGIASDAEDDFHALFGKAFSKAYDEQMARFKGEK
jgi:FHA domain-containing protein